MNERNEDDDDKQQSDRETPRIPLPLKPLSVFTLLVPFVFGNADSLFGKPLLI